MATRKSELVNHFMRGAVAAGLISALQHERAAKGSKKRKRAKATASRLARHSLQGGFAVATGLGVANALQAGHYRQASTLLLLGAAGIAGSQWLLNEQ